MSQNTVIIELKELASNITLLYVEDNEGLTKKTSNHSHELFAYFENLIPEYKRRERL